MAVRLYRWSGCLMQVRAATVPAEGLSYPVTAGRKFICKKINT
jgi:hypothetical protein